MRVGALSKEKMVRKPPIKKLWINGRVSEDREECMDEVWAHYVTVLMKNRR